MAFASTLLPWPSWLQQALVPKHDQSPRRFGAARGGFQLQSPWGGDPPPTPPPEKKGQGGAKSQVAWHARLNIFY
jgi:hypothetical protein